MSVVELDCRRLLCPMPVIKVQDAVAGLQKGQLVTAICTDPGVLNDIPAWCRINGHEVISSQTDDDEYRITIKVAGDGSHS